MQFTTLFAVLATAITMVQAVCYDAGETWTPDQVQANVVLACICETISGDFTGGETKSACRNAASTPNKKFEFYITNTAGNSVSLNHDECVLRLGNEVNGCTYGGETTISTWQFRADPNSGRC